jgi:hypothetical protein
MHWKARGVHGVWASWIYTKVAWKAVVKGCHLGVCLFINRVQNCITSCVQVILTYAILYSTDVVRYRNNGRWNGTIMTKPPSEYMFTDHPRRREAWYYLPVSSVIFQAFG